MSQFESSVKVIPYAQERVYGKLSDLNNVETVKEYLPADKINNLSFDADSLSFTVSSIGQFSLKIVERTPFEYIKLETINSPLPFKLWIQIIAQSEEESNLKLLIEINVNPFMKGMIQKPLQEGLEKMVETLALIQY